MSKAERDIISDAEIERVHANANFGSIPKRDVVVSGCLQTALGYHVGHTMGAILKEHGLVCKPRTPGARMRLSEKGFTYLRTAISPKYAAIGERLYGINFIETA